MKKTFKRILSASVSLIMLLQCVIIGEFSIPAEAAFEAPSDNYAYLNPADYDGDLSQSTPKGLNSQNWMSYLPDNACLSEINIPGSHDAASFNNAPGVSLVVQAQECNVKRQLNDGSRFLDIRLGVRDVFHDLVCYHDFFICYETYPFDVYDFSDVFRDCRGFLKDHSSETIILSLQRDHNGESVYRKKLKEELGKQSKKGDLIIVDKDDSIPTLGESRGKIVIIKDTSLFQKYEDECDASPSKKEKNLEKLWKNPRKQNYDLGASDLVKIAGALDDTEKRDANVPLVYYSSCYGSTPPCQRICGSIVNEWIESYKFKKGYHYGWCLSNTVGHFEFGTDVSKSIYMTNYFCNAPKLTDDSAVYWGVSDGTLYLSDNKTDKTPSWFYKNTKFRTDKMPWYDYRCSIKSVKVLNTLKPKYTDHWFDGLTKAESFYIEKLDTSETVSMDYMFRNCYALRELDISSFKCQLKTVPTGMFDNDAILEIIYADPAFRVTANPTNTEKDVVFGSCNNLVGGNDTKFTKLEDKFNRMCIDKEERPGYFTDINEKFKIYWGISNDVLYLGGIASAKTPNSIDSRIDISHQQSSWIEKSYSSVEVLSKIYPVNMARWFRNNKKLVSVDFGGITDTSGTVTMDSLFCLCTALERIDLSGFSCEKLKDGRCMFQACSSLEEIIASENFDLTNSNGNFVRMFDGCTKLKAICGEKTYYFDKNYIENERACVITESRDGYFTSKSFYWTVPRYSKTLYLSNEPINLPEYKSYLYKWNRFEDKRYTEKTLPWESYSVLVEKIVILNEIRPQYTSYWFNEFFNLKEADFDFLDTSLVKDMSYMFNECDSLVELDISGFDCSSLESANKMFAGVYAGGTLKTIYVGENFDLTKLDKNDCKGMFSDNISLVGGNGTVWDRKNPDDNTYACIDEPGTKGYFTFKQNIFWGISKQDSELLISGTRTVLTPNNYSKKKWNDEFFTKVRVIERISPSSTAGWFALKGSIKEFDLELLDTSKTENMSFMFSTCSGIKLLDLTGFSAESLKEADGMFTGCQNLKVIYADESFDLSDTDVIAREMFSNCKSIVGGNGTPYSASYIGRERACIDTDKKKGYFTNPAEQTTIYWGYKHDKYSVKLYINGRRTELTPNESTDLFLSETDVPWYSLATEFTDVQVGVDSIVMPRNMRYWFSGMKKINSVDFDNFSSSLVKDTAYMFRNCVGIEEIDLRSWNLSNINYAAGMFEKCTGLKTIRTSLGTDLRRFNADKYRNMFYGCDKLIGGNGTKYSYSAINNEYACVDSKYVKGYFTADTEEADIYWNIDAGTLYISGTESLVTPYPAKCSSPEWTERASEVNKVIVTEIISPYSTVFWFSGMENLSELDIALLDTSNTTNMRFMFAGCPLKTIDISSFDCGRLKDAGYMFENCTELTTIYANSAFDFSVKDRSFSGYNAFKGDTKLIGGNGTAYDENNDDKMYGCVDLPSCKGYFTEKNGDMKDGVEAEGYDGIYDGSSHSITVSLSGKAYGASVEYSTEENGTYTSDIPTFINAGEYMVYYKVTKPAYNVVTGYETIKISPYELKLNNAVLTPSHFIYDGSDKQPQEFINFNETELANNTDYKVTGTTSASDLGEYETVISGIGNFSGEVTLKWHIIDYDMPEPQYSIFSGEYDGEKHTSYVILPESWAAKAVVTYGLTEQSCTSSEPYYYTNAGYYTYWALITPNDHTQQPVKKQLSVTIKRKKVTVTADSKEKWIGTKDPELTYTASGLVNGDKLNGITLTRAEGQSVGEYVIFASADSNADTDYDIKCINGKFIIKYSDPLELVVLNYNGVYDGEGHYSDVMLPVDFTGKVTIKYGETEDNCTSETPISYTNAGIYTSWCLVVPENPAVKPVKQKLNVTISPKNAEIIVNSIEKWKRDPDPKFTCKTSGIVSGDSIRGISFIRENGESVGTYIIYASVNEELNPNYNINVTNGILKIKNAGGIEPVIFNYEGVYDGEEHTAYAMIPSDYIGNASIKYGMTKDSCTDEKPYLYKDAGKYVFWCRVASDNPAIETVYKQLSVNISPKEANVTADSKTKNYGEKDPQLTYTVNGLVSGEKLYGVTVFRELGEKKGKYTIYVEADNSLNPNYSIKCINGVFTITNKYIPSPDPVIYAKKPEFICTKSNDSTLTVEWSEKYNADGYRIQYMDKNGKWQTIKTVKGGKVTNAVLKKLKPSTNYMLRLSYYTLRNGKRYYKQYCDILSTFTAPVAPKNFKVSAVTNKTIKLSWKKDSSVSGYQLQMFANGKWTVIKTYGKNTIVGRNITGLKSGTKYKFRLRSYVADENGNKIFGEYKTISVKTKL